MDVHRDGMKESLASDLTQIATLTAERDDYKAHFEVCDANRQQVVAERDAALATIAALRVAAGAVCGFPSPKAWERLEEVLEKCSPQTK